MATPLEFSSMQNGLSADFGCTKVTVSDDGGIVDGAKIIVGYGRRNIENLAGQFTYVHSVNYSDRVDFRAAAFYNYLTATAIEELLQLEVPARAEYIRVLLMELNRISNHLLHLSYVAEIVGQKTIANYCMREWERFCDIFEMYCGSRLGFGSICIGGVREDATDGWLFRIEKALSFVQEFLPEYFATLVKHPLFIGRASGLALVSEDLAKEWRITGPVARASNLAKDLRIDEPYSAYAKVPFEIAASEFCGDAHGRVQYRISEVYASIRYIRELVKKIPQGNFHIRVGTGVESEAGNVYRTVEGPRGRIGLLFSSAGGGGPSRVRYFTPSSGLLSLAPSLLMGARTDDVLLGLSSLDLSVSEVDK